MSNTNLHYTFIKPATFAGRAENVGDTVPLTEETASKLFQYGVIRPATYAEIEKLNTLQQAEADNEALNRQIDDFEEMAIANTAMATEIQRQSLRIKELEEMADLLREKAEKTEKMKK